MDPFISIFGRDIPIYGICWMFGIFLAGIAAVLVAPKRGIERYDVVYSAVFSVIAGVVGSKLMFIAVSLKTIIEQDIPFMAILKGGFVFYGGLIGGAVGLFIYTYMYKLSTLKFFDLYALVLPLGHACGRVGCFFAGCCYGMPYDGLFSHVYTQSVGNTPLNVPLLPIQLIEAILLFLLFLILLAVYLKKEQNGLTTAVYLYAYSVIRFSLEFFRGDAERGILLGFSTSQIVSLLLIVVTTLCLTYKIIKRKSN